MQRKITSMLLVVWWLAAVSASLVTSYRAGCAGDTKGGTVGDVYLALDLEGTAFGFDVLAFIALAVLLSHSLKMRWAIRGPVVVAATFIAFVCTFLLGFEAEHAGIRSCF